MTRVFAEICEPRKKNTNEGQVHFSLSFKYGDPMDGELIKRKSSQISYMLESIIKQSKVLDVETLGISLGKLCWKLVVEISLLEYDGSIEETVLLSVLAVL